MGVVLYTMEVFDLGGVRMERSGLIGWIGQPSKTKMGGANYRFKDVGTNVMWQIYFRNTSLCCGLMYYSKSVGTTRPLSRLSDCENSLRLSIGHHNIHCPPGSR